MENVKLLIVLIFCMAAMLAPLSLQMKWRGIPLWKSLPVSLISTVGGIAAVKLWYWLENGDFTGLSFFGVIFLGPILFLLTAALVRIPFSDVADICAAAECIVLVIMKVQCQLSGCCGGKFLFEFTNGFRVYFPSRIVELINAAVLLAVLLCLVRKGKHRGGIYPAFMILYGVTRFVLNFFRWDQAPFAFGLAAGTFWSLCAVVIGGLWLVLHRVNTTHCCHPERSEGSSHRLDNGS